MKRILILSSLLLAGCVTNNQYANFNLKPLASSPRCRILYDSDTLVINEWKGDRSVVASGDDCPKSMPNDETLRVSKKPRFQMGDQGAFVRYWSWPDEKTGVVTKTVLRRKDPRSKRVGKYQLFQEKL